MMETSQTVKEIAGALCEFQGKCPKIKKNADNPFFKSKYADLSDIQTVVHPVLHETKLSYVQFPIGTNELTTLLMHAPSGEWIKGTYSMTPVKNDPQGSGSCITYMKRYALAAVLGLNIEQDDDDGNEASSNKVLSKLKTKTPTADKDWKPPVHTAVITKDNPNCTFSTGPMKWTAQQQKALLASGKFGILTKDKKSGGKCYLLGAEGLDWDYLKDAFVDYLSDKFGEKTSAEVARETFSSEKI